MAKRMLDAGQSAACKPRNITVDEWKGSFEGEKRKKLEIAIDPVLQRLDELLAQAQEKTDSLNPEIYITKASVFSQLRDHEKAIKYFEKAIEVSNDFEMEDVDDIRFDLALEYENVQDYASAIRELAKILENTPDNEAAIYEIAYCYERTGNFDQCIEFYNKYIDNNPYSFTAWYNLGNIYFLKNNIEKAVWP